MHVKRVWQRFWKKNVGEYLDLYIKSDTLSIVTKQRKKRPKMKARIINWYWYAINGPKSN